MQRAIAAGADHGRKDPPRAVLPLTTKQCDGLLTSLEPPEIDLWIALFISMVKANYPAAGLLLSLDASEARVALSNPEYAAANLWVAIQIRSCLNPKATQVLLVVQRAHKMQVLDCGYRFLCLISDIQRVSLGGAQRLLEAKFKAAAFLRPGLSLLDVQLASSKFVAAWNLLPRVSTRHNAIIDDFLLKVPESHKDLREKLQDDVLRGEVYKNGPTFEDIVTLVGIALEKAASPTPHPEAHVTETDIAEANAAALVSRTPAGQGQREQTPRICLNCGDPKHDHKACTAKCNDCQLGFCPGVRGKSCVVNAAAKPGSNIKNAIGKVMPASLLSRLQKEWTKKHPAEASAEADVTEVDTLIDVTSINLFCGLIDDDDALPD